MKRTTPGISFLKVGAPSLAWTGGALSGMGCMVPQPFVARGNRSYTNFFAITSSLQYPGVFYPDSSPRAFR
jgi:hypothetical protein